MVAPGRKYAPCAEPCQAASPRMIMDWGEIRISVQVTPGTPGGFTPPAWELCCFTLSEIKPSATASATLIAMYAVSTPISGPWKKVLRVVMATEQTGGAEGWPGGWERAQA